MWFDVEPKYNIFMHFITLDTLHSTAVIEKLVSEYRVENTER